MFVCFCHYLISICADIPFLSLVQKTHLSRLGGDNIRQTVKRMMREVIAYKMACQFNMYGHGTKKAFAEHPVFKVIIRKYIFCVVQHTAASR